jgi:hypothetical protein
VETEDQDAWVCEITGLAHSQEACLVAETFANFSGQQKVFHDTANMAHEYKTDVTNRTTDVANLEKHSGSVFQPAHEASITAQQRVHEQRMKTCKGLMDMLLFSDTRESLNEWGQKHAHVKTNSSILKYIKAEQVHFYEHVWRISCSETRETEWCRTVPERGGGMEQEAYQACEAACVWWNRFQPTTQCKFEYHALAAFYVFAKGLRDGNTQIIEPHHMLLKALPGVNKLNWFPDIDVSTFTAHEHMFRTNACKWYKTKLR